MIWYVIADKNRNPAIKKNTKSIYFPLVAVKNRPKIVRTVSIPSKISFPMVPSRLLRVLVTSRD